MPFELGKQGLDLGNGGNDTGVHYGLEEFFFTLEVQIQSGFGYASTAGNVLKTSRCIASLDKQRER